MYIDTKEYIANDDIFWFKFWTILLLVIPATAGILYMFIDAVLNAINR